MSGAGLIQLVAVGAQDVYLNTSPNITFFKSIWRRYSNFAMETSKQSIDLKFGGNSTVQLQRFGDLVTNMAISVKLPAITSDVVKPGSSVAWVRRVGHAMIKEISITIGGSYIDKHTGTFIDIWYELTHSGDQESGYLSMIGDVPDLTTLRGPVFNDCNSTIIDSYTIYVPMNFWFNKSPGTSLPLVALLYHEVRVNVSLEEASKLLVWSGAQPNFNSLQVSNGALLVDYVYLAPVERKKIAQSQHDTLIEIIQSKEESIPSSGASTSYNIHFNHPTKELIWATKVGAFNGEGNGSYNNRGTFLAYSNTNCWQDALLRACANLVRGMIWMDRPETSESSDWYSTDMSALWNGKTQMSNGDTTEFVLCLPMSRKLHFTLEIALDSDCNNVPMQCAQSSSKSRCGAKNATNNTGDRISQQVSQVSYVSLQEMPDFWVCKRNLAVVSDNCDLGDKVEEAFVTMSLVNSNNGPKWKITHINVPHDQSCGKQMRLTLDDVSIPIPDWKVDNRYGHCDDDYPCDVVVTQFSNYGVRLDGRGNLVDSATITLNNTPRFSTEPGAYFNYLQPYNHHSRIPCDGICTYSFSLNPEEQQPSGSVNLSRIDTTQLQITFKDPLRNNRLCAKLDYAKDSKLYLFALSYNVLRITNGMAGLGFAS